MKKLKDFLFAYLASCWSWLSRTLGPLGKPVNPLLSSNYYYNKPQTRIYFCSEGSWFGWKSNAMEVHLRTFEVLNSQFAKDKNQVYLGSETLSDPRVELESFEAFREEGLHFLAKDHQHVYDFRNPALPRIIESANPKTFFAMDSRWAKDDRHYFYNWEKLAVHYKSFERISPFFGMDLKQAYYFSEDLFMPLEANIPELEKFSDRYLCDDKFLYFFCDQRRGEPVKSLERIPFNSDEILLVLDSQYIRVGNKIYCDGELVEGADATQFRVINDSYAKDTRHVYWWGLKIRSADPATFHYNEEQKHYEDKRFRFFRNKAYPKAAF